MQVRTSALNQAASDFENVQAKLATSASQLQSIISKYRDVSSVNKQKSRILSMETQITGTARQCRQMGLALNRVGMQYQNHERKIIDECEGVRAKVATVKAGIQNLSEMCSSGGGIFEEIPDLSEHTSGEYAKLCNLLFLLPLDMLNDTKSTLKDIKTVAGYAGEYMDNEFVDTLYDYSTKLGKNKLLKVAGYLDDGKELIEALEHGDAEKVEETAAQYLKKGVKALTGIKGTTVSVWLDTGWNIGQSFVEGIENVAKDPSVANTVSLLWDASIGAWGKAVWDAGTDLAGAAMGLVTPVFGQTFNQQDFDVAMDYLGDLAGNALGAVRDGIVDSVITVGGAIWDGAVQLGETIGSWFKWS